MHFSHTVTSFVTSCREVTTTDDLHTVLGEITRTLGFEQFAMNHHVDLVGRPADAISLMNYDQAWIDRALARQYYVDDPIHIASARRGFGFLWSEVPGMLKLTRRQRQILEEAREYGLCEGYTVPVHLPGEYSGTCSFGARSISITEDIVMTAQMLGLCAFEAARRLIRSSLPEDNTRRPPELSPRQLECLTFASHGKSDSVIAQILGMSSGTVHHHIKEAMRRYGVASRVQCVVRALYDGQICYQATLR